MDWLNEHFGSLGYAGDFYVPQSGSGSSSNNKGNRKSDDKGNSKGGKQPDQSDSAEDEQKKDSVGVEQIKAKKIDCAPQVAECVMDGYPRIQKFFEWEQFLDYVDWQNPYEKILKNLSPLNIRRSQKQTREGYVVTKTWSFQEAMELARYGWHDGLEKVKELKKIDFPIKDSLSQNYEIETRYNVAGGAVNIGRYLSGIPDCMRHMHIQSGHSLPSRIQKIFVIGDYHKGISAQKVIKHGYEVYQIVQALEMVNIQTEIVLVFSTCKNKALLKSECEFYETYIKIKDSMDIIYPEKLLFCVAHPSMFRRLVFSEWERNPGSIRRKFHFYGNCVKKDEGYGIQIDEWQIPHEYTKDAIVIPGVDDWDDDLHYDMYDVLNKVEKLIKSQYEAVR